MVPTTQFNSLSRRGFLAGLGSLAAAALAGGPALGAGGSSPVDLAQIVYPGGNWLPRPSALRRLAWEVHKRTAIETALEPSAIKPVIEQLAGGPLAFLCGDRPFPAWDAGQIDALSRFLRLGGTLVVDPAFTADGAVSGFDASVDWLLSAALPRVRGTALAPGHLVFRTFYDVARPVGRVEGPAELTGYSIGERLAVIRSHHDLGGAWARDNLGNWEYEVTPGGSLQRENAFRLGINLVMYALCQDYKDEQPHRRFGAEPEGR
ncbi:MAG TPA: DUF4159 domain-containing protein [Polyangia bacterium]|nr:DUF4159 domain-containing protein [Polyangia bacterium]